jgi:glycosyltransferase involved in cell wall biosynthesis
MNNSEKNNKYHIVILFLGSKGGGAKYSYELIKSVDKKNECLVTFYTSNRFAFLSEVIDLGVNVKIVETQSTIIKALTRFYDIPFAIIKFMLFCMREKVNCIYSPMTHPLNPLFVLAPRYLIGIDYILTMHDAKTHIGESFHRLKEFFLRLDFNVSTRIICLTSSVEAVIKGYMSKDKIKRIGVIPHGSFNYISKPHPRKLKKCTDEKIYKILFFGRILKYKGLDLLLRSGLILAKRGWRNKISISIVGSGDINEYKVLIDLCQQNGVCVEIHNEWIAEESIPKIFISHDLLITPYVEASQSGVISIALATGLPVISTPVGGLVDQLKNGGGFISEAISDEKISDLIEKVLSSPMLYEEASQAGIKYSTEVLSWDRISHDVIEFCTSPRRK